MLFTVFGEGLTASGVVFQHANVNLVAVRLIRAVKGQNCKATNLRFTALFELRGHFEPKHATFKRFIKPKHHLFN